MKGRTAFILVRQEDIDKAEWGEEIRQLENLRLLHRIKDAVPNTANWRGVKCIVFMVDLGQVAHQRLRAGIPDFWSGAAEFDKLRRAEWIYGESWKARLAEKEKQATQLARRKGSVTARKDGESTPVEGVPLALFEDPRELDPS